MPPGELLVHLADSEVTLTIEDADGKTRDVTVKTLRSEFPSRYREWVEANRERVHRETNGRVGYVHIPDMGAHGYAEFHRTYLAEVAYDGADRGCALQSGRARLATADRETGA